MPKPIIYSIYMSRIYLQQLMIAFWLQ